VSNVSHELRTPLTSILGYTKLLLSERLGSLDDRQKEGLKIINDESERLTRLINDVLDISKLEAGKVNFNFKPNNIITLIEEIHGNFQNVITEKELIFKIKIEKNVPTVAIFDYDKLKQVFINLLSNAFKFTPDKGKISITIKSKDGFITTSIRDNGEGIPKENIKNLFNKFYQVDSSMTRKQGGSGLGLAISKEIVEKHNGKIYVESDIGKGSNFVFKIPLIANKLSNDVK
jgi:signal transduction histidine kinase